MLRKSALQQSSRLLQAQAACGKIRTCHRPGHALPIHLLLHTSIVEGFDRQEAVASSRTPYPAGHDACHRQFSTELTAGMTLLNKGLKAGPGGRSSVSVDVLVIS